MKRCTGQVRHLSCAYRYANRRPASLTGSMETIVEHDCETAARRGDTGVIESHCPYCALQCGMNLVPNHGAISIAPRNFPTNKGGLCQKGWTAAELLSSTDRLLAPLMRAHKGDRLRPVSWDEALDRVAREFVEAQARYGRDAAGVFGGGGLTNEKAYLLGKFARCAQNQKHRLTGASACPPRQPQASKRSVSTAVCRFRWTTSRRRRRFCWLEQTRRRRCRRSCSISRSRNATEAA